MARYRIITTCNWVGCEQYHEIEGDFDNKEDALEEFGGAEEAYQQALEDHDPQWEIEKIEED